jgi:hypothetical protein
VPLRARKHELGWLTESYRDALLRGPAITFGRNCRVIRKPRCLAAGAGRQVPGTHSMRTSIRAVAQRAKHARKEADRLACEAWNMQMLGYDRPIASLGAMQRHAGVRGRPEVTGSRPNRRDWTRSRQFAFDLIPRGPIGFPAGTAMVVRRRCRMSRCTDATFLPRWELPACCAGRGLLMDSR